MIDETDIDISAVETGEPDSVEIMPKARKRFGLAALLGAMFVASALGAGIITLLSHFSKPAFPDLKPLQAEIKTVSSEAQNLAKENKALKAQIARLQRDIKNQPASAAIDMKPLESRVKALEQAEPNAVNPKILARLEALQTEGSEALDLSEILERIDALESRPIAPPIVSAARVQADMKSAIEFPSDAVLATLDTPEGWLKKSLKKHISVQSDDNPRYLVELINTNIEAGNIQAAIAAFDKLPPDAKAAGKNWRASLTP